MMLFSRTKPAAGFVFLLLTGLLLLQPPALAQETTGSVSGAVQDATGAIIPRASVVLTNVQNKTERKTVSNGSGNFTIASVTSGARYQLTVTMQGFKPWRSQPFDLLPGDRPNFTDIKMQIGEVSSQVTVEATASQAVKPLDTPERSDVITSKDLETLAIVGRDAEELIETLPGFSLISPGVNNTTSTNTAAVGLNNGISGGYSGNGLGPTGLSSILDGVSLTDIQTNSGTVQTMNSDMIQNVKISTANFSAVSAKGPAIFNATTKSGTSSYHGEAYLYARDTALNANDWYNNYLQQTRQDGTYFFPGANIGGPLFIPHTRFDRHNDKLFFFFGFEALNQKYSPETLGSWTPTMAERAGDFSVANLNAQLCGARPDGLVNPNAIKTMCYAENYLANGTEVVNGNVMAQANAGGKALVNWLPLPNANPFTNFSGYNYVQPVVQTQNGNMLHASIDFPINDNNKLRATYGRQSQITEQPVALGYVPSASALYPGAVTTGDISNIVSVDYTHVFGASVTNELNAALSLISDPGNLGNPAAVDRFTINGYNCSDPTMRAAGTCGSSGNGNFNYLGDYKQAGDYSVPALADYNGNLGYPNMQMPGGFYSNRVHMKKTVPDVQDSVTWAKGPHTFEFGVYYEKGILNGIADTGAFPQGEYSFNPGTSGYEYGQAFVTARFIQCENPQSTGTSRASGASDIGACINPIAMMYMGTPDSFQQTNFTPIVDMQYTTLSGYVNDQWKLLHRVTLVVGARIEHLGPWTDRHGNGLATFSPALYNQQCSRANGALPSCSPSTDAPGITWHGIDSTISNSVNNPPTVYFTPRVGLAWDIFGHGNTVLRGGWGVYRHEEEFAPYAQAAATAQGYKTTRIQNQNFTFDTVDSQAPVNPADFSVDVLTANDTVRPVYFTYNATISQRLKWNSLLEVAYVGSNSQNLGTSAGGGSYNEASDVNLIPAGYMFQSSPAFCICDVQGSPNSIAGFSNYDLIRPFPFYNHIFSLKHDFYSNYNSLQVSWNKSSGWVQYGVNYTFSKDLATAASYNNQLVDPVNLRNDYNPAPFDRTHAINAHYLVDLGRRYHGDHHLFALAANGWQISGISTFQSGVNLASGAGENFGFGSGSIQPIQVSTYQQEPSGQNTTCGQTYGIAPDKNGQTYCVTNLSSVVWLGTPDYQLMPTVTCNPAGGSAKHQFINPTCFGVPVPGSPSTGPNALSSNPSGQGQDRLPYIHGPAYQNHNLSVYKNFGMGEAKTLQFHASGFNFLNHPLVSFNNNDNTNLNLGSLNFATVGQSLKPNQLINQNFGIANIKYGSRLIELGAKYTF
ncbi:MAG TPA: carboxypeptidase regulatory-like domain-containing protein [Acidobacteriaceae bacterium]|nr:carboxypeptidase regulatory-like domain-containing protein [Acidobacteriaceae bacterium]